MKNHGRTVPNMYMCLNSQTNMYMNFFIVVQYSELL